MRFAALRAPSFKGLLAGGTLLMAGDNAEHAITYLAMWQAFHSPLLAGFAIVAHWAPHLFFGVLFGGLADRFDNRRIIQIALGMFALASIIWGVLLATDTLQPWHCVLLLLLHGFASALWRPADQLMIYDIVGPEHLPSGVRLLATGISLGQLVGPAIGAVLLSTVGPAVGLFVNVVLYVPFLIYLFVTPATGHRRRTESVARPSLRGAFAVLGEVPRYKAISTVLLLQAAIGLLIGMAIMTLLPEFGELLGSDGSGVGYALLLTATAAGAVTGGLLLEGVGRLAPSPVGAASFGVVLAVAAITFALSRDLLLSVAALFVVGIASLASESTSQTVVQLGAPSARRGAFMGVYSMTSLGSRMGSGVLVAVLGGLLGVSATIAINGVVLGLVAATLVAVSLVRAGRALATGEPEVADSVPR
ncbi:MFS transporter [Naasia aerilata]|uniref:MFS transporter n=1 Tax=Naasia aerilata TaxID=1162966 RepID=A0ABM8GD11_9MICO|nr:MFS transporter [Naasia aerilata]BDZ46148.1 MFS transporter [Naasia aerilata]